MIPKFDSVITSSFRNKIYVTGVFPTSFSNLHEYKTIHDTECISKYREQNMCTTVGHVNRSQRDSPSPDFVMLSYFWSAWQSHEPETDVKIYKPNECTRIYANGIWFFSMNDERTSMYCCYKISIRKQQVRGQVLYMVNRVIFSFCIC
jgi:hypothetical protein